MCVIFVIESHRRTRQEWERGGRENSIKFIVLYIDVNQNHWLNGRKKIQHANGDIDVVNKSKVYVRYAVYCGLCLIKLNRGCFEINCSPFRLEWRSFFPPSFEKWAVSTETHWLHCCMCVCTSGQWPMANGLVKKIPIFYWLSLSHPKSFQNEII